MRLKSPPFIPAYNMFGPNRDNQIVQNNNLRYNYKSESSYNLSGHREAQINPEKDETFFETGENIYGRVHIDSTLPTRLTLHEPYSKRPDKMVGTLMKYNYHDQLQDGNPVTQVEDSHYAMTTDLDDLDDYGNNRSSTELLPWEWWAEHGNMASLSRNKPQEFSSQTLHRNMQRSLDPGINALNQGEEFKHLSRVHREASIFAWLLTWLAHFMLLFTILVTSVSPLPWIIGDNVVSPGSVIGGLWGFCLSGFKIDSSDSDLTKAKPQCISYVGSLSTENGGNLLPAEASFWTWAFSMFKLPYPKEYYSHTLGAWMWCLGVMLNALGFVTFLMIYLGALWSIPKFLINYQNENGHKNVTKDKSISPMKQKVGGAHKITLLQSILYKVNKYIILLTGYYNLLATVPLVLSCTLYPLGWNNRALKIVCSRRMSSYNIGDCSLGLGYYMALLCILNGVAIGWLGISLAYKIPQYQSATKFRLSKKYTSNRKYWKTENEILAYNFSDEVVYRKPNINGSKAIFDNEKSIYSYLPSTFKNDKSGYNLKSS